MDVVRKSGKFVKICKENASSPLLRLPPEIRNRIWEFALGVSAFPARMQGDTIVISQSYWTTGKKTVFPLLYVCRQIYGEAALIPYHANIFDFTVAPKPIEFHFISMVGQENIRAVHYYVKNTGWKNHPFERVVSSLLKILACEDFSGLRRIVIDVEDCTASGPIAEELKLEFDVEAEKLVKKVAEKRKDLKVVFLRK
ncbi:hypothetical protein NX059_003899 [Plenodomus lindquistii]|nr:hypothetical protein NX059_003899 [Plenodomus lindquistii]